MFGDFIYILLVMSIILSGFIPIGIGYLTIPKFREWIKGDVE